MARPPSLEQSVLTQAYTTRTLQQYSVFGQAWQDRTASVNRHQLSQQFCPVTATYPRGRRRSSCFTECFCCVCTAGLKQTEHQRATSASFTVLKSRCVTAFRTRRRAVQRSKFQQSWRKKLIRFLYLFNGMNFHHILPYLCGEVNRSTSSMT